MSVCRKQAKNRPDVCFRGHLAVQQLVMEKQSMLPPAMQRIAPPQPIKRAAPSSYLQKKSSSFPLFILCEVCTWAEPLLLLHKQRVEKLRCDLVGVDGARRERADAWEEEKKIIFNALF